MLNTAVEMVNRCFTSTGSPAHGLTGRFLIPMTPLHISLPHNHIQEVLNIMLA